MYKNQKMLVLIIGIPFVSFLMLLSSERDSNFRSIRDLDPHDLEFTEFCIDKIFTKYGSSFKNKSETMNEVKSLQIEEDKETSDHNEARIDFSEFSHLLAQIGLLNPEWNGSAHDHQGSSTPTYKSFRQKNLAKLTQKIISRSKSSVNRRSLLNQDLCLSPVSIFQHFNISPTHGITKHDFAHLCPVLIFQLDQDQCRRYSSDDLSVPIDSNSVPSDPRGLIRPAMLTNPGDKRVDDGDGGMGTKRVLGLHTWAYALSAVTVISLCGFCLVCLIPLIRGRYFNNLLQFFVALAIGSLSGDALLHLLPHALAPDAGSFKGTISSTVMGRTKRHQGTSIPVSHHDSDGREMVWKGFLALCVIFSFFCFERLATILAHVTKYGVRGKKGDRYNVESNSDPLRMERYQPIRTDNQEEPSTYSPFIVQEPSGELTGSFLHTSREVRSNDHVINNGVVYTHAPPSPKPLEHPPMVSRISPRPTGEFKKKKGLSVQAVTVIFGDGIHNFFDGVAIGAAFSGSITAGISTALAVLCHELPHEIGDFAYLIKLGISIRRALWFNCLSTVFCIMGCVAGLSLGAFQSASSWIFASIAGMFIYIAFVNMLPELKGPTHSHHTPQNQYEVSQGSMIQCAPDIEASLAGDESRPNYKDRCHLENRDSGAHLDHDHSATHVHGDDSLRLIPFVLQIGGIGLGVCIMLLIALYEEDIKRAIS